MTSSQDPPVEPAAGRSGSLPATNGRVEERLGVDGPGLAAGATRSNGVRRAALTAEQRRFLILLGAPAFGLSVSATIVTTYLPVFIEQLSGPAVTGALIGMEGLFALAFPVMVGAWSDRTDTRFGRRLPFMLAATPLAVLALVLMPFVGSLLALSVLLLGFWLAYFTYYPPYRALYPDLVPTDLRGRSQGAQKVWRQAGLGVSLVGGGLLLAIWRPLPFLLASAALLVVTIVAARHIDEGETRAERQREMTGRWRRLREALREPNLRNVLIANSLWESAVGTMKAFVVLFFTIGLGRTTEFASAVLAVIAVAVVAAALVGGYLADRWRPIPLLTISSVIYGTVLFLPAFTTAAWVFALIPFGAFAAGIVVTLPYALIMGVMPSNQEHGLISGIFEFSRGFGVLLGPAIAGLAIQFLEPVFPGTNGYAAMWPVAGLAVLASLPFLRRIDEQAVGPHLG
ncbi:MAG: MFS transporter [Solirubrobacterales bacterium]